MKLTVGLPDLHPGKGHPIGAAFFSQKILYPYLVGNDIGCGMGLWQTNLLRKKVKLDRWLKKLAALNALPDAEETAEWLHQAGLTFREGDQALGTPGGGNHFAELQLVHAVVDEETFNRSGLVAQELLLLVHSGSRGLGEAVLRKHIDRHANKGLAEDSADAEAYLHGHNQALQWAKRNRALIAHRFLSLLGGGAKGRLILDLCHNSLTRVELGGSTGWLHRKGAAPADQGMAVIPGSRGSFTYLVLPCGSQKDNCCSIAHGAGRKWNRSAAKARMKEKCPVSSLLHTSLGGRVLCHDKDILYEEAPQAYKDIDIVVKDLQEAGLIKIVALLQPLLTFKESGR
jgi:release factor H-coupled RctB family protein